MKTIDHLREEHRMFEELLDSLDGWLESSEPLAPSHVEDVLRAFLQALQEHEAIERLIFEFAPGSRGDGVRPPKKKDLRREHEDLFEIKEELLFVLDNLSESSYPLLKKTIGSLADRLRSHFRFEEDELWPSVDESDGARPPKGVERDLRIREHQIRSLVEEVC